MFEWQGDIAFRGASLQKIPGPLKLGVHFFEEKSPFLIRHNDNGLIYCFGDIDDFYEKLKHVVENEGLRRSISLRGCESISGLWNESGGQND